MRPDRIPSALGEILHRIAVVKGKLLVEFKTSALANVGGGELVSVVGGMGDYQSV